MSVILAFLALLATIVKVIGAVFCCCVLVLAVCFIVALWGALFIACNEARALQKAHEREAAGTSGG